MIQNLLYAHYMMLPVSILAYVNQLMFVFVQVHMKDRGQP